MKGYILSTGSYLDTRWFNVVCTTEESIKEMARQTMQEYDYGAKIESINVLMDSLTVDVTTEDEVTTFHLHEFEIK